jgi:hypothetical protein
MGKGVSGCGIFVTGIRGVPVSEIGGRLPGGYEAFMGADSGRIGDGFGGRWRAVRA